MAESNNILLRSKKRKAEELLRAQRLPEARAAYVQLCQQNPHDHESWLNLGALSGMLGLFDEAEAAFRKAAVLRSDEPRAHFNLARLYELQERFDEAISHWQTYLRLRPEDAEGYGQLGKLLHRVKRLSEAEQALREALRRAPDDANYCNNLGVVLHDLGRYDEALSIYQRALQLQPKMDEIYCNQGNLHHERGEDQLAEASYAAAIEINPRNAGTHMSLGHHHAQRGHYDKALQCFNEALRLNPEFASAHWNLALLLLLLGQFHEGWREYEWRFSTPEIRRPYMSARYTSKPLWDGAPLIDKTLLVYVEQGFGDTLQFCRYLPLIRQRVERVIVECQPELLRLLRSSFDDVELIPRPADNSLPPVNYDVQIPLMSLPRVFNTEPESVPQTVPYIHTDPQQTLQWRQRLAQDELNVGLVWAGNPGHWRDRLRSMPLTTLAPLSKVPGVTLYSLQKGPASAEAAIPPEGMKLIDLAPELDDFAATAAVIANLDLVITVDTAVAHLAGALGKPVWTLIYSPPDWRWLLDREDSPWYPTMRLFRQNQSREWETVIEKVAMALSETKSH